MLEIECEKCNKKFNVKGYTTPDSYTDPGEVVTDMETDDDLCQCLQEGGLFTVIGESHESFDDDAI